MKLFTKEIEKKIPNLYETENTPASEVKVIVKLFLPWTNFTWYITEMDKEENLAFGFANLGDDQMAELGYISIDELEQLSVRGCKVERDTSWDMNTTLEDVKNFKVR